MLNGTSGQTWTPGGAISNTVNVTVNDTAGVTLIGGNLTLPAALTLTNGVVTTGANTLIMATNSVSRTAGFVNGNLQKPVATGATVRTFELGTGTTYSPVTVTFASVTTAGNLTAKATAGDQPSVAASGIDPTHSVNRYWTITSGGGLVFTTYSAAFTFANPGDLDAGTLTTGLQVRKLSGTWATPPGGSTSTTTTATGTAFTSAQGFGDFAVGQLDAIAPTLAITAPTVFASQSTTSYNVIFTATDSGSGVNLSTLSLQRQRAAVVIAGSCPTSGYLADGSVTPASSPVTSSGLQDGFCYQWVLTGSDNAGNAGVAATSARILVDTTTKLVFTTSAVTITAGGTSGVITIQRQDAVELADDCRCADRLPQQHVPWSDLP